jgi:hypothetical protein
VYQGSSTRTLHGISLVAVIFHDRSAGPVMRKLLYPCLEILAAVVLPFECSNRAPSGPENETLALVGSKKNRKQDRAARIELYLAPRVNATGSNK